MNRLTSMRVFLEVVNQGSFSAAARSLDISAAVVTRLVADLEGHLGSRLLHRSTRRLSLSAAGEVYAARVRSILSDIEEADQAVGAQTQALAGVLRLLAPPVLATHVIAPLIAGFRQLYPNIFLEVEVASYKEPPIEDYDITLMPTDGAFDGNVIARKISATGEAVLVASPAYIDRKGVPITPQDLKQHDVLRLKAPGLQARTWPLFNASRSDEPLVVSVDPVLWINHSDTLLRAAMSGAGITSAAIDLVAPYLLSGELVRVLSPWISGRLSLYAALPSRKFMPERTRVFLEYLTDRTRLESSRVSALLSQQA